MKLLQINAVYSYGSTGVIVRDIHECCLANGIDSYVAFPKGFGKADERTYEIGNVVDRKGHAALSRIAGKQGYFSRIPTWNLLRYIDRLQPDIVHLHNLHSNYVNLEMLLRFLAKKHIKTVINLHDCWFYTGGCFHYTATDCWRWKDHCGNCPRRREDTPAFLYDASARVLADRIRWFNAIDYLTVVGVSQWVADEFRKSCIKAKRVTFIHNGVDINVFRPTPSDLRERLGLTDKFVVLAPASKWLLPINRETLNYFVEHLPADSVLLLFGCDGRSLPIKSPKIKTYGFTRDRREMAQLYTMADVMVNTSREDTFSLLNAECQACGTSVVTHDATGLKETVDNVCGFAVRTGHPDLLFEALCRVREMDADVLSTACRERVKKLFDKRNVYLKYVELYRSL